MESKEIDIILESQKEFFRSGATLPVDFRIEMLKKLYSAIEKHEEDIAKALTEDLGKSSFEGYMCEIGLAKSEISYMIRNTRRLSAKRRAKTPLALFAASSYQKPCPYGNTLIMSPWNYPFLLTIDPLADAIAAGNTAIIKPSAYSPATSAVVKELIEEVFPQNYIAVVLGGRKENSALLEKKFDFIFFTGSTEVGKIVLRHAAEHLTPAVLELGGKSPCIVDSAANIKIAARRIAFGKYLNCGQTCVAPDYILCHKSVKDEFIAELKKQITAQFGKEPLENPDYGKIVNEKHFERLLGLIDESKTVHGGRFDPIALRIEPTVMDNVTWEDPVMREEIFGPVLPVLTFEHFDEIYTTLAEKPKPLACYIFSDDKNHIEELSSRISYGGGCINDTVVHVGTTEMGFGGVGESGMGSYHGKTGFDTFSHIKSIVHKKNWIDLPLQYQPYSEKARRILHRVLK